jgi:Family of unknown function (DUF5681)
MRPKKSNAGLPPRLRRRNEMDEGKVGYRKPPEHHRFRRGQSGNPQGRPKGAKNESTILREILARRIDTRSGGRVRKITVLEGILLRITDDSLKGDIKSAAFLLNRYGAMVSGELQREDLTDDDREVLEAFALRFEAQRSDNRKKA